MIGQEGMPEINYDPRQARATSSLQGWRVCRDWQREHLLQMSTADSCFRSSPRLQTIIDVWWSCFLEASAVESWQLHGKARAADLKPCRRGRSQRRDVREYLMLFVLSLCIARLEINYSTFWYGSTHAFGNCDAIMHWGTSQHSDRQEGR